MDRMTPTDKKPQIREPNRFLEWVKETVQVLFVVLFLTFLVLTLLELLFKGSVSLYFNLDYWFIAVIVVGTVAMLTMSRKVAKARQEHLSFGYVLVTTGAGIGSAVIVWLNTRGVGWFSYLLSLVSCGVVIFLSMLHLGSDDDEEADNQHS